MMKKAILAAVGLVLLAGCVSNGFSEKYNARVVELNNAQRMENMIIDNLRNATTEAEKCFYAKQYLDNYANISGELVGFREFIDENYKDVEGVGIKPEFVRDNTNRELDRMGENRLLMIDGKSWWCE